MPAPAPVAHFPGPTRATLPFSSCQSLRADKDAVEDEIASLAHAAARDLGLVVDKTIKLEWHRCVGWDGGEASV